MHEVAFRPFADSPVEKKNDFAVFTKSAAEICLSTSIFRDLPPLAALTDVPLCHHPISMHFCVLLHSYYSAFSTSWQISVCCQDPIPPCSVLTVR